MRRYKYFIFFLFFLFLFISKAKSQQLNSGEYYFDNDPGFGSGIGIPVTFGDSIIYSGNVPLNSLNNGFHSLNIRVHNVNGIWSLSEKRLFYIQIIPTFSPQLIYAEYFIDSDPGFGNGIGIPFTSGDSILYSGNILLNGFNNGFHALTIRIQDTDGQWSLLEKRLFYIHVIPSFSPQLISAEYYFDADPGFGNGNQITVSQGDSILFSGNITVNTLTTGFHSLFIRTQDLYGKWSISEKRLFCIQNANGVAPQLVAAEYYINSDPGFGNGIPIAGTNGDSIDFIGPFPLLDTAPGNYSLYIRVKDTSGKWSIPERRDFKICLPPIANFDYSVNGNYSVIFSDSSLHNDTANWTFGDGTTSILPNPIHTYSNPGTFTACLIERNACGVDTICKTIEVPDLHITSVSKSEVIPGDTFSVSFSANLYQAGNVFYLEANGYDGTFNHPFILDSISGFSNGMFSNVRMPYNITPNCYSLRIRSTSPKAVTSENVIIKVSVLGQTTDNFALKFDGVDDYVDLGNWFNQPQFTISFWVKPDSIQTNGAAIIDMQNDLILYSNPTLSNNYILSHLLQFDLLPNQWNHVTITMDGATNTRKVYLFGQLISENAWNYSPQNGHTMSLGNGGFLPGYFKGYIDELKIWDHILSSQEIYNQVTFPLIGNESGLLSYYDFNLGCGDVVDLTNNHHNGINHGASSVTSDLNSMYGNNIQPASSGNVGFVTVKIFHGHFTPGCIVKLKQAGYNSITALSSHVDSLDNSLICQFFFNYDSIGTYNLSVENLDSTLLFFPNALYPSDQLHITI